MKAKKITKNEIKILEDFFDRLEDEMGDAGCNDYYLPNTKENYDLIREVIICDGDMDREEQDDYLETLKASKKQKKLFVFDTMLLRYLREKLILQLEAAQ